MTRELSDDEIDTISDDAKDAALHAWGPLGSPQHRPCPYRDAERCELWYRHFNRHYANENGY